MLYPFNLSFSLSLLFMGFLFANFFGIITSTKNVIFIFIMCIELINCFVYTQSSRLRFRRAKLKQTSLFKRIFFLTKRSPESFFSVQKFSPPSTYDSQRKSKASIPRTPYPVPLRGKGVKGYSLGDVPYLIAKLRYKMQRDTQPEAIQKRLDAKALTRNYSLSKKRNVKVFDYVFTYTLTILNFLKIGFEFGFFVDAFKLGS